MQQSALARKVFSGRQLFDCCRRCLDEPSCQIQSVPVLRLVPVRRVRNGSQPLDCCEECLGNHGVTSNYRFDLAPYTWELVKNLRQGTAIFTQPPMPIKCAGAPQKAMYLSCSHWHDQGVLTNINVAFHNAGGALFGARAPTVVVRRAALRSSGLR